jgi:hypothetical protein
MKAEVKVGRYIQVQQGEPMRIRHLSQLWRASIMCLVLCLGISSGVMSISEVVANEASPALKSIGQVARVEAGTLPQTAAKASTWASCGKPAFAWTFDSLRGTTNQLELAPPPAIASICACQPGFYQACMDDCFSRGCGASFICIDFGYCECSCNC